jgi:hypothetical protein
MTDFRIERGNLINISELMKTGEKLKASHRFLQIANRHAEMIPLIDEFIAGMRILDRKGQHTLCGLHRLFTPVLRERKPVVDSKRRHRAQSHLQPDRSSPSLLHTGRLILRQRNDSFPGSHCRIFHTTRNPLRKNRANATRLTAAVLGEPSH